MKNLLMTAVTVAAIATAPAAQAGGLFGSGGLIRGSIGNFLDKHVEKPILTPVARGTAVAVGTAVGTVAGAAVGAPQAGAVLGAGAGQFVNEAAAGRLIP